MTARAWAFMQVHPNLVGAFALIVYVLNDDSWCGMNCS